MGSTLAQTDRLCRARHVVSVEQGGQSVLLDTRECRYHTLENVGSRVWQLLRDGTDLRTIVSTICSEYDAPAERISEDVAALITNLRSIGLVHVEGRALPVIDNETSSALPPLYATWISQVLDGPIPVERHATCDTCAMAQPVGHAATASTTRFDPHVKCCSYLPVLPNYLVGQILSDLSEGGADGRASVRQRLAGASVVTPLGIGSFPEYATVYKHASSLFGKSEALRCPHFIDAHGGLCGIWRYRNSTCATFFCKCERGAVGKMFWDALLDLLVLVERSVACWCAAELGLDARALGIALLQNAAMLPPWAGELRDAWGPWSGREETFFVKTGALAQGLSWDQVVNLGGVDLRASIKRLQKAYAAHQNIEIPPTVRLAPVSRLEVNARDTVISGYNPNDMLLIATPVARALDRFDGHRTTVDLLAEVTPDVAAVIDESMLRRLVDFRVLVPLPDLAATDLGLSVDSEVMRTPGS